MHNAQLASPSVHASRLFSTTQWAPISFSSHLSCAHFHTFQHFGSFSTGTAKQFEQDPEKKLKFPTKILSTSFCYSGYGAKTVWAEDIVKSKEGLFKYILGCVCTAQCTVHCRLQQCGLRQGGLVVKHHLPILEERRSPWIWPSLMWVTLDNCCRSYICATPAAVLPVWPRRDIMRKKTFYFRALLNSTLTPLPNSGNVVFFSFYWNIFARTTEPSSNDDDDYDVFPKLALISHVVQGLYTL